MNCITKKNREGVCILLPFYKELSKEDSVRGKSIFCSKILPKFLLLYLANLNGRAYLRPPLCRILNLNLI